MKKLLTILLLFITIGINAQTFESNSQCYRRNPISVNCDVICQDKIILEFHQNINILYIAINNGIQKLNIIKITEEKYYHTIKLSDLKNIKQDYDIKISKDDSHFKFVKKNGNTIKCYIN